MNANDIGILRLASNMASQGLNEAEAEATTL